MGGDREYDQEGAVQNNLSGNVTGPVGQFGAVYGDVHLGAAGNASGDAQWQARYRERLERQWAEEDAARAAEWERAQRLQRIHDETPAIQWRIKNQAWRKQIATWRILTLVQLVLIVSSLAAFHAVGEDSGARGPLALGVLLILPGIACFLAYLITSVRYRLWRQW